jgi:hypothetical protein
MATKKTRKLLRTPFMAAFTKEFIGQPGSYLWPKDQTRDEVVADFQTFANVLLAVGYGRPAPTGTGKTGAQILTFLGEQNWPGDPKGIPKQYLDAQPTVRLVEVAVILDRLLRAINSYVPPAEQGGGPGGWPPH